ncbi:MAG: hypothetical protein Q7R35_15010 [Elusimicrobiota bacterium]|nr:hypothetical protein [Elusimicrobiota bacterium]
MDYEIGQLDKAVLSLGIEVGKTNLRMDRLEDNIITALRSFKSDLLSAFESSVMKGQMCS